MMRVFFILFYSLICRHFVVCITENSFLGLFNTKYCPCGCFFDVKLDFVMLFLLKKR